jgi:hypothetical protein
MEARVTPNSATPPSATSELIFVDAYHNLPGISDGEWVQYYLPGSLQRLRTDLRLYIQHHLDLFSESYDYEDYFSQAEYEDPEDALAVEEMTVFRSALSPEDRGAPWANLWARDLLHGYRAVMLHRISTGDLDAIRSATEMFNGIMESAIEGVVGQNPRCYVYIETAKEFGPKFVDRILGSIKRMDETWRRDPFDRFLGEEFKPLRPILETLGSFVQHEGWPHSDLSIGRLLLIVDYYVKLVEEKWRA